MGFNVGFLVRDLRMSMLILKVSIIEFFGDFVFNSFFELYVIVGLFVNYLKGNGLDEFWEILVRGEFIFFIVS